MLCCILFPSYHSSFFSSFNLLLPLLLLPAPPIPFYWQLNHLLLPIYIYSSLPYLINFLFIFHFFLFFHPSSHLFTYSSSLFSPFFFLFYHHCIYYHTLFLVFLPSAPLLPPHFLLLPHSMHHLPRSLSFIFFTAKVLFLFLYLSFVHRLFFLPLPPLLPLLHFLSLSIDLLAVTLLYFLYFSFSFASIPFSLVLHWVSSPSPFLSSSLSFSRLLCLFIFAFSLFF